MPYVKLSEEERKAARLRGLEKSLATRRAKAATRKPTRCARLDAGMVERLTALAISEGIERSAMLERLMNEFEARRVQP